MSFEEQLYAVLSAVAPAFPLVPVESQTAPYILYRNITNNPEVTLENTIPINNTRIQIDAFASTYAGMKSLASQIQEAMSAASFTNIPRSSHDGYEDVVMLFRFTIDYSVWY